MNERAKNTQTEQWAYGTAMALSPAVLLVLPDAAPKSIDAEFFNCPYVKVKSETLCKSTGCEDVDRQLVYEHDVVESILQPQMFFEVAYGEYSALCDLDGEWMPAIGFFASNSLGDFPLGELEVWARIIGNLIDTPELEEKLEINMEDNDEMQ